MTLSFSGVFADARAQWRAHHDVLLRVAAVFMFLPTLAAQLFLPPPVLTSAETREAMTDAITAWFGVNGGWFVLELVVISYGAGALLVLLLGRGGESVGEALFRALRLLPALLIAWTCVMIAVSLGSMLLIVVSFYIGGRLLMTGPVVVAEPGRGPFAALVESVKLSRRNGWLLSAVTVVVLGGGYLAALVPQMMIGALAAAGQAQPLVTVPLDILSSAGSAAGWTALVLVQASAYRLARQGI